MKHLAIYFGYLILWVTKITIEFMRLAALFSGGKDSAYAIYLAKKQGHDIVCLLTLFPNSEESHLLHYPNLSWVHLQAESMKIPQLIAKLKSDSTDEEIKLIDKLLIKSKKDYGVEGLVHGGIKSQFQKNNFEKITKNLDLKFLSPLWNYDPNKYMNDLLSSGFDFIITSVSSAGLDDNWLGKKIEKVDLKQLEFLAKKFEFNLNFEGGEAETFVVDCPLFSHPIEIIEGKNFWDGYRGRFEIVDARLNYNA